MTYDELKEKIYTGDPLADKDRPQDVFMEQGALVILGEYTVTERYTDQACDLRLTIVGDAILLQYRANKDTPELVTAYPYHWSQPLRFECYEDAAGFAYEL